MTIANGSQVRVPCESPVPSRPVPSIPYVIHDRYVPSARPTATRPTVAATAAMDGGDPR